MNPPPDYISHRIKLFEGLKAQYDEEVAKKPRDKINITLDNDRIEIGTAWETTPSFVARQISKSLSERIVIARVNGELWDLDRPLESSCRLELLDFEHPEGMLVLTLSQRLHCSSTAQGRKSSGTQVHMYLEKLPNEGLDVTYASDHRSKMVSTMRWLCLMGMSPCCDR